MSGNRVCLHCFGNTEDVEIDLLEELEFMKAKKRGIMNELWVNLPDNEEYV